MGRDVGLDFEGGEALRAKSVGELVRGLVVWGLCGAAPGVLTHGETLLEASRRVLGARLWGALLRATFYGHFVGGETPAEVWGTARRLRAVGLSPMLALPTEEDVGQEKDGEGWYEANRGAALECVGLAAATGPRPLMQLKVTALMSARLCEKLSQRLAEPGGAVTPESLAAAIAARTIPAFPFLTPAENQHLGVALQRLEDVSEAAARAGVTLLVDAERSCLNPALSAAARALMLRRNRHEPWVWNTHQAYLRGGAQRLAAEASWARGAGLRFGAKLVRGAYLELERRLARERGRPDPTQPSLDSTHRSYGECVELGLGLAAAEGATIMVATHNEASVLAATRRMAELGLPPDSPHVCFGQLYGMCDHISLALAGAGFRAHKSVPVGGAGQALPYLLRRARENRGVLAGEGGAARERRLLLRQILRRARLRP